MSTELVVANETGISVVDPDTGEVTRLEDTSTLVLARVLGFVQQAVDQQLNALYEAKRALGSELIERMDRTGVWTIEAPGVKIVAPSPAAGRVEWDAEKLDAILDDLVAEGLLDRDAKLRAVTPEVTLKVDKRGVNALLKIPVVAERVNEARIVAPPSYRKASVRVDPREL